MKANHVNNEVCIYCTIKLRLVCAGILMLPLFGWNRYKNVFLRVTGHRPCIRNKYLFCDAFIFMLHFINFHSSEIAKWNKQSKHIIYLFYKIHYASSLNNVDKWTDFIKMYTTRFVCPNSNYQRILCIDTSYTIPCDFISAYTWQSPILFEVFSCRWS